MISERFSGENGEHPGRTSPYWGEHVARYKFALPYVENKTVLDVACGTGYGIGVLQDRARYVVGVDVSFDALTIAKHECGDRSAILSGDGVRLPFADNGFDAVTSFETLEHLEKRPEFLSEMRRVLKPRGVLILSTPNANYTLPVDGKPSNPFHIHEYTPEDLLTELKRFFRVSQFVGQFLSSSRRIPPFYDAQKKLPKDPVTQISLFSWKIANKLPFALRNGLSRMVWRRPFFPADDEYDPSVEGVSSAPVLIAVCENDK